MFSIPILTEMHDVDVNGVCRTSTLLRYLQIAANSQLAACGMTYDALKEKKRAFILSRIYMEFDESPRAYVPVEAATAPCESRGFRFLRSYELSCGGRTIGRATSVWALIDTDTRALIRVSDFTLPIEHMAAPATLPAPIRFPAEPVTVGEYRVTYAELDQNGHMNNTHYPDVYADFLPMNGMRIASLCIDYRQEVRCGEVLTVQTCEADGFFYFRTLLPDGRVNSEAQLRLVPLS